MSESRSCLQYTAANKHFADSEIISQRNDKNNNETLKMQQMQWNWNDDFEYVKIPFVLHITFLYMLPVLLFTFETMPRYYFQIFEQYF